MKSKGGTTSHLPMTFCPACFYKLDAATSVYVDAVPAPGDYTVCLKCAAPLKFEPDMSVSLISLMDIPTHQRREVARVVQAIKGSDPLAYFKSQKP